MRRSVAVALLVSVSLLTATMAQTPEPADWYAGDMHVHRSCGAPAEPVADVYSKMSTQNLAAMSLLADMGNGEVQDPVADLPKVNGQDDPISSSGRILHWDAEWHWDAIYTQFPHQALGGHVVALGLTEAHQIWEESTYPIFDWAHKQNAIAGFAHLQYLSGAIPQELDCCSPLEFPVEVALGSADFISEDVNGSDVAVDMYYKLLNSGLRPGFAAGTDYPCSAMTTPGSPLTYAQVAGGVMTYRNWIDGIAKGRTVVSRDGHNQFLDLKVNSTAGPGDEINLVGAGTVQVNVSWTATRSISSTIELIQNGAVIDSNAVTVDAGSPATMTSTVNFDKSGWLAARVSGPDGHSVHTAAVFIIVDNAPIRASEADAQFFVQWIDNLIARTTPGGPWETFLANSRAAVQARYQAARAVYQQAAGEAAGTAPTLSSITVNPSSFALPTGSTQQFTATGSYSDSSTVDLTGQVRWTSSDGAVATTNRSGLVLARSLGTTDITAALGAVSGMTQLTVQVSPLAITTPALTDGTRSVPYTATLAATGGTEPYTWSIISGALPTGLSLDSSTGAITGTPTLAGIANFTVQVADAGDPQQTVSKSLNLAIADIPGYFSLWNTGIVPSIEDAGGDNPVELGITFRSDVNGTVTGIRFYKAAANIGPHVGQLWNAAGDSLGSVSFDAETESGWQQATFATPIVIHAGLTYVASYHTNVGHYSTTVNYFTQNGWDAPPLHALKNGGVFGYGSDSTFPSSSWAGSNYWVDVMVVPEGADTTPPTVSSTTPADGSANVDTRTSIAVTFDEPIDPQTINPTTLALVDSSNNAVVSASMLYNNEALTVTLSPLVGLRTSTVYTATLKGGALGVKDLSGNPLAADLTWSFTTGAPPAPLPPQGPGGPILLVTSSSSPMTQYSAEILRAEGLNLFGTADITQLSPTLLSNYQTVMLGAMPLSAGEVTTLSDWVSGGGTLIALRPDKQLAAVLGLSDASGTMQDAYLAVDTAEGPGIGIVPNTIQFHGVADEYILNGATAVATLYSDALTPSSYPAVTLNNYGAGRAMAFTYDLARSIVYTRQGNPAWSGQARDAQYGPIRSDDLFFGAASFDPQPDYVNLDKVSIPQADEQQRLLANAILSLNDTPLPRFWYLPRGLKAVVVMTGDDHSNNGTQGRFESYITKSPANCQVNEWQCVRATSYMFDNTPMTDEQAAAFVAQGFEIGLHVDVIPECSNWTPAGLVSSYSTELANFAAKFPSVPTPKTERTHCIAWSDYDSQPKVQVSNGIRLDTNYYYWPATWVGDRPGFFTGSGMPMRFADREGDLIDVYQAATQLTDESGQSYPMTINTLLDNALGAPGFYGVFTANMHNDVVQSDDADAIIASAQSRGVPIISALQMLTWLDGRNGSSFGSLNWSGHILSFTVAAGSGANGLQAMVPATAGTDNLLAIILNGSPVSYTLETIKGRDYAVFTAASGTYRAKYAGASSLSGVSVESSPVMGGNSVQGTVTLSTAAPEGGAVVALTSSDTNAATVPETVTVSAGATSATFTVATTAVSVDTDLTISASYDGVNQSAPLTVLFPPTAVVSPTSLAFGNVQVNTTSAAQTVTLTSTNSRALQIAGITLVGATSSWFGQTTDCGASLDPLGSCTITVVFKPTSALTRYASLQITTDGGVFMVPLRGTGALPSATVSTRTVAFGNVQVNSSSAAQPVVLSNTGLGPITISSIGLAGTGSSSFSLGGDCSGSVAAGASCTASLTFNPTAAGARGATLSIQTTAGVFNVAVTGTGVLPSATISTTAIAFGSVQVNTPSAVQPVVLTNTGSAPLAISNVGIAGAGASYFNRISECGTSLAAGANCTINVTFTPTAAVTRSANLSVQTAGGTFNVTLSGTGVRASATVSTDTLAFGNVEVNTASAAQPVVLSNTGLGPISVSIPFPGPGAPNFSQSNDCGTSLASGAHCTINVTFKPIAGAARTASLSIRTTAGTLSVALSGTGVAPTATLSTTSIAFGSVQVNTSSAVHPVVLTNTGVYPVAISNVAVAGASASYFNQTSGCGASLPVGESCTIGVTFTPTAAVTRSASLSIQTTAGTLGVALSGTGVVPSATVSTRTIAFGSVQVNTSSAAQAVVLTNTGIGPISISGIALAGAGSGYFSQGNDCGESLAAGANCTINVRFTPTAAVSRSASLSIRTTAGTLGVALSGTGVSPSATVSTKAIAFGTVQVNSSSTVQPVVLTNSGVGPITLSNIAVAGASASYFRQSNECGASLAPGANCTISVTFTPTAAVTRSASLLIQTTAGAQAVALSGTGVVPTARLTPGSYGFGNVVVGNTSAAVTATLTNTGIGPLNITDLSLVGAGAASFVRTHQCPGTLAAGESCTIDVTFAPQTQGAFSSKLMVTSNAAQVLSIFTGTGI